MYGVKVLCVLSSGVVLCVFSQEQIGRGHVYIEYSPKKVLKVLLLNTPRQYFFFVRVKCEFIIFPGKFFLYVFQTKMVIASGSENNVSLRHSPKHLLPGGEPCKKYIYTSALRSKIFVETHSCKLCVILQSRVLLGVCSH